MVKSRVIKSGHSTVFDNSLPISIVRRHSGIISVERRKLMTSVSSTWGEKEKEKPLSKCCSQKDKIISSSIEINASTVAHNTSILGICGPRVWCYSIHH